MAGSLIEQRLEPVDVLSGARCWGYEDGQCTVMPSWGLQMRLVQGQKARIPFLSIIRATPGERQGNEGTLSISDTGALRSEDSEARGRVSVTVIGSTSKASWVQKCAQTGEGRI